ncbi:hypothetical protein GpSGHVEth073 [Glossina pallidipes salivary gland hypertrophy virus]|uniref:Uncharacterized protein n=1 Tax=Glossina hytrovirus (isolate Glossina pallidipes/Ethiopia/Seibersdorf/-) TaxID=379529 RepID=A0A0Y0JDZ4_GHVS|nr:hypothetical protein GpSGHVEth073 [Glossina pallidipes salivary gland hypertrophy virus]
MAELIEDSKTNNIAVVVCPLSDSSHYKFKSWYRQQYGDELEDEWTYSYNDLQCDNSSDSDDNELIEVDDLLPQPSLEVEKKIDKKLLSSYYKFTKRRKLNIFDMC